MLVLSRRINEKIVLPSVGAALQVVALRPGLVRLGVEAPDNVPVFREEVLERLDPAERARLMPARSSAADRVREPARYLNEALSAAVMDLAQLRRHLANWQREDLGAALDRIALELKAAQHKAGVDASPAVAAVAGHCPEFVVY